MLNVLEGRTDSQTKPGRNIVDIQEVNPDVDAEQVLRLVRKAIQDCSYCAGTGKCIGGHVCSHCRPLRQALKDAAK